MKYALALLPLLALSALAAAQDRRGLGDGESAQGLRVMPVAPLRLGWAKGSNPREVRSAFTLGNVGKAAFDWEATVDVEWIRLGLVRGSLQAGGRRLVGVELDPFRVLSLSPGEHEATIRFVNQTDGRGEIERRVVLLVRGEKGIDVGLFDPARQEFCIENQGAGEIRWRADTRARWLHAEPEEGTLEAGSNVFVRCSVGAGEEPQPPNRRGSSGAETRAGRRAGVLFVNDTDGVGTTLRVLVADTETDALRAPGEESSPERRSEVESFGITWTFTDAVPAGRFVNGDPWVLGPVAIAAIRPASKASGFAPVGGGGGKPAGKQRMGRVMNGSMISPSPARGMTQGYDSATYGKYAGPDSFDPALDVALGVSAQSPLVLRPGTSLVSTISNPKAGMRPQVRSASILTVLGEIPPGDAFRPPYTGNDKRIRHRASELQRSRLTMLRHVASTPPLEKVERMFERPWIDHVPLWYGRYIHPSENMPDYGREITDDVSTGALMLLVDFSEESKETLLVRYVQLGIDLFGLLQEGERWPPSAGHLNGRKWPILFAGLMLGDEAMQSIGEDYGPAAFSEDGQTFVIEKPRPELGYTRDMIGIPEWSAAHATRPELDDPRWFSNEPFAPGARQVKLRTQNVKYRLCCTANTFWGELLAAYVLGAKELWNHDPLFLYQDRFYERNKKSQVSDYRMSWRPFYYDMWERYRSEYGGR